ncbi:NAD-dependent epimerase/dehydratase family protein [Candidatus Beckwithbacteria bacterium]|nr:NAD-dependent epimerase/dehydratase family protein [Candidatus Beckwithbacteria bacterium]
MKKQRCVIFGGGGFIGNNLLADIGKSEKKLVVVGISKQGPNNSNCQYIQLKKIEDLENIIEKDDEVINLSYATVPKTSFENPIDDVEKNLPFAVKLFSVCAAKKIKKIIHLSSGGAVYGEQKHFPIIEQTVCRPISPYGISKQTIDSYAHFFYQLYQLPVVVLRPSNAYGPGQIAYKGQGLIATVMASILDKKEITIHGQKNIRDYVFIEDIVRAIIAGLKKGKIGKIYNIGTGQGASNQIIVEKIKALAIRDGFSLPKINIILPRPFDVSKNILSYRRFLKDTDWRPEINLDEGLQKTWTWFLKNYHPKS